MNNNLNNNETKIIPRLNPSKARNDIKVINDVICEIQRTFANAINNYFKMLYPIWTSPKALEFYSKAINVIKSFNESIVDFNEKTVHELVLSFNGIAPMYHESSISLSTGPYTYLEITKLLDVSSSGTVGMVDKQVESITKDLSMKIKNLRNKISGLPKGIYFYNTEGRLAGSYNVKISEFNYLVDNGISKILNLINEVDNNIVAARRVAQNAASLLS